MHHVYKQAVDYPEQCLCLRDKKNDRPTDRQAKRETVRDRQREQTCVIETTAIKLI